MAVSVAACAHYFAAAFLFGRGLPTDGLTVEVESEKERVPVSRIGHLALKIHLPAVAGHLSDRQLAGDRARHQELPGLRDAPSTAARRDFHRGAARGATGARPEATSRP